MIDGFKNREVFTSPVNYTCNLISGNLRNEYLRTGSITIPYVMPPERPRNDFMSRNWDIHDGLRKEAEDNLMDYLDYMDENEEL